LIRRQEEDYRPIVARADAENVLLTSKNINFIEKNIKILANRKGSTQLWATPVKCNMLA
jgi:hypothetical protein